MRHKICKIPIPRTVPPWRIACELMKPEQFSCSCYLPPARTLTRNRKVYFRVRLTFQGRNGKGNIYVWASGDGGEEDDCNCDGYAASMWTISINSAINDGQNAHYDESCSSTLASTFSNGAKDPNTGVVSDLCLAAYFVISIKKGFTSSHKTSRNSL